MLVPRNDDIYAAETPKGIGHDADNLERPAIKHEDFSKYGTARKGPATKSLGHECHPWL